MLSGAMQTLAGSVAAISPEVPGATLQRRMASCPVRARPRISWMRGDRSPRISSGRLRPWALGQAPPHRRREPEMIYAGVDIAKADHLIGAIDEHGAKAYRSMAFKNTEAGLERAITWLEGLAESLAWRSRVTTGWSATRFWSRGAIPSP